MQNNTGTGGDTAPHHASQMDATGGGLAAANSGRGQRYRSNNLPSGTEISQLNHTQNVQINNQQYQLNKNGRMNKSPSPHEFFR